MNVLVYLPVCGSVMAGLDIAAAHLCHLGDPALGDHHGDRSLPRGVYTNTQTHTHLLFDSRVHQLLMDCAL